MPLRRTTKPAKEHIMPGFADVKAILDTIKDNFDWDSVLQIHSANGTHMENPLDWQTKAQLQQAVVWRYEGNPQQPVPYRLIDVSGGKKAADTYLIRALSGPFAKQVNMGTYPRMPNGGPYLSPTDIQTIADWIDAAMPD
jgi:hypothetical protein